MDEQDLSPTGEGTEVVSTIDPGPPTALTHRVTGPNHRSTSPVTVPGTEWGLHLPRGVGRSGPQGLAG